MTASAQSNVIIAAGTDERVAGLVYIAIAALAPNADETSQTQIDKFGIKFATRRAYDAVSQLRYFVFAI